MADLWSPASDPYTVQLRAILDALEAHVALIDRHGQIQEVNRSWRRFAVDNGLTDRSYGVGGNYLTVCDTSTGDCSDEAVAVARGIRAVLDGVLQRFAVEYPCHSPTEQRWFRCVVTPVGKGTDITGAVIMHVNVTDTILAAKATA
ncbi:MAG: hypothetical protein EAZ99_00610 [Alphaproteobacteria bacterium]|nr:hypothetical protein [Alphaproteobacteria bacterium]TAD91868.1 MAG: hypothetical protein EAZ99_00610 [Alphaproteobacteria bacterium]